MLRFNASIRPFSLVVTVGLMAFSPLLLSCAGSQPTRFYTLAPIAEASAPATSVAAPRTVGVGPVGLPRYLDRPQIVSRDGPYRLRLADFDNWAEPLENSIPRVLARNLKTLLATEDVLVLPQRRQERVDATVEVEILRFDFEPGNEAVLTARWAIFREDSLAEPVIDTVTIREPIAAGVGLEQPDYEAAVAALSATLGELSRQIAAAL